MPPRGWYPVSSILYAVSHIKLTFASVQQFSCVCAPLTPHVRRGNNTSCTQTHHDVQCKDFPTAQFQQHRNIDQNAVTAARSAPVVYQFAQTSPCSHSIFNNVCDKCPVKLAGLFFQLTWLTLQFLAPRQPRSGSFSLSLRAPSQ